MNAKCTLKTAETGRATRRSFLKQAGAVSLAVAGFPSVVPSSALAADGQVAPSNRITVGCIGVGPQGCGVMGNFLREAGARVVAVCDVNRLRRDQARTSVNEHYGDEGCAAYNDFRELLVRDDIDAVLIASPDHWHVPHGVAAAKAGKDMYVEKPLMLSLRQGQALREAIQRYGRVFQYGTQQRSSREFRFACELVHNKRIGGLRTIKVGSPASRVSETLIPMPVPDWLDYDLWLGPAPWAAFSEKRIINQYWWHNSDYALGFVAGWGIHHVDIAQWGNGTDLTGPVEVEGTGEFPKDGFCDCATKWNVLLRYATGVVLDYTDEGQNRHGITFEGTDGWVYVARGVIDAHPKRLLQERFGPDEVHLYESRSHVGSFLECVRTRARTVCPIDVAVRSDMICHLSDIAMRLGRKLRWDPETEQFEGDDGANRMLTRAMRSPWQV
jgi:predicted dehydrogenase